MRTALMPGCNWFGFSQFCSGNATLLILMSCRDIACLAAQISCKLPRTRVLDLLCYQNRTLPVVPPPNLHGHQFPTTHSSYLEPTRYRPSEYSSYLLWVPHRNCQYPLFGACWGIYLYDCYVVWDCSDATLINLLVTIVHSKTEEWCACGPRISLPFPSWLPHQ